MARGGVTGDAAAKETVAAWRPEVPGVAEVLYARFIEHAYPAHTHDTWTVLLVDDGMVRYGLDQREHGAPTDTVALLPPHVPHTGRAVHETGFRKRVLYLDEDQLGTELIGAAVDRPSVRDPALRRRLHQLHGVLGQRHEELEAQSRLTLIRERLTQHLTDRVGPPEAPRDRRLAGRLRELLDARVADGVTLDEAAAVLGANPAYLVRAFHREYGLPPHQYLTGRRVDVARRLLLAGQRPSEAAVAAGFYDQSHLNRHFRRVLGTSPGRFIRQPDR
ncbi:helix-turn-helix domain-containing protein [Yinghuangia seranimata]|uniref:helix-turn-helix domain-containing protein n=1 Tax=Yinghuangia seranimata TaxID=408067 RepID=UPI00248B12AC|nr:AraC family transcriptional regulator [Yinghuangia seranimata]MDI2132331.1 AraC family transcriptional regulator [Yinghuangia seranimata]